MKMKHYIVRKTINQRHIKLILRFMSMLEANNVNPLMYGDCCISHCGKQVWEVESVNTWSLLNYIIYMLSFASHTHFLLLNMVLRQS